MVSCVYAAMPVMLSIWWRSVVSAVDYSGLPALRPSGLPLAVQIAPGDFVNPWILCTGCTVCRERRKRWSGHRKTGHPGAEAARESDEISRCVCAERG